METTKKGQRGHFTTLIEPISGILLKARVGECQVRRNPQIVQTYAGRFSRLNQHRQMIPLYGTCANGNVPEFTMYIFNRVMQINLPSEAY